MSNKYKDFIQPVLIIANEEIALKSLVQLVEEIGLKAICAKSINDGIDLLKKKDIPCMVLSEIKSQEENGEQLCLEVKKIRPDMPFVLISENSSCQIPAEIQDVGFFEFLSRPFQIEKLSSHIHKIVDARIAYLAADAKENEAITALFVEDATLMFEDLEKHILRLEEVPVDPSVVDVLFRNVHTVKGSAGAIPGGKWLAQVGHSFESCLSLIKNGKLQLDTPGMELFLFTSDLCQQLIELIKQKNEPSSELSGIVENCVKSLEDLRAGKSSPARAASPSVATAAKASNVTPIKNEKAENEGVWVTNEKLDSFMKLSGELIVLKNYFQVLGQEAELKETSNRLKGKITDFSYSLNKITDNLQDQIMSIRKVTLDRALSKLPRIFRQVTKEVDKKVKLTTEGFELGVDRTIASALSTCLTHMLRNAIDHGIETAEVRKANSKPSEGNIVISVREQRGTIYLTISDDGGGIDKNKVISKAIDKGLLEESRRSSLTDAEAFDLLFLPGFSTAEKVTGISGRGVEMDVVKSEIINLKGRSRIESQLKVGTTFHIEIPVPKTVMVEQTVLVKSGDTLIAVPLNAIAQLTTCSALSASIVGQQRTCQFQGKTLPLKTYSEFSDESGILTESNSLFASANPVVILQHKKDFIGLLVDSIHDQLEAVIRPFDKVTNGFTGFKGTTVLGDDSIAYVIAPDEFVSLGLGLAKSVAA